MPERPFHRGWLLSSATGCSGRKDRPVRRGLSAAVCSLLVTRRLSSPSRTLQPPPPCCAPRSPGRAYFKTVEWALNLPRSLCRNTAAHSQTPNPESSDHTDNFQALSMLASVSREQMGSSPQPGCFGVAERKGAEEMAPRCSSGNRGDRSRDTLRQSSCFVQNLVGHKGTGRPLPGAAWVPQPARSSPAGHSPPAPVVSREVESV